MDLNEELVLKVLALGVKKPIADHHAEYLLNKLYGKDGCSLDPKNSKVFEMFKGIAKDLRD